MDASQTTQSRRPLSFRAFALGAALGVALLAPLAARAVDAPPALDLTAPQQQKLAALESASRAQADALIGQIHQLRHKLSDLYGAYKLDAVAARRINQDLNRVQGQLLDLRLSEQQQLRGILSADQFAHLQAAMHQPGFRGDHGPGPFGPDHGHGPPHWPDH